MGIWWKSIYTFGYSDPDDINSDLKIIESSYILNDTNVINRPSGFASGFFIDDYYFNESGDLDIHNGRFGKLLNFPMEYMLTLPL